MKVIAYGITDVGLKRKRNEDNLLIDEKMGLFILADGMGGHKGGDTASHLAVTTVHKTFKRHHEEHDFVSPNLMIEEAYSKSSSEIFNYGLEKNESLKGMGTTLVTAYVHKNNEIFIGNVGDSRAYYYNDEGFWQITEDHSLFNSHIKQGLLKEDEFGKFQFKNIITRSVGFENEVKCDILQKKLNPGDRFLLCSDGLTNMVKDEEIYEICKKKSIKKAVETCITKAKKNGGDDNITTIIIEVN